MKHFFLPYKKLHIWLLSALGVLLVLRLCRGNRAWMNALAEHVTIPLRRGLGELCYRVDGGEAHYGDELMNLGLLTTDSGSGECLPGDRPICDFDSHIFVLKA